MLEGGVFLLERSAALGSRLRHLANNELGVTHMQVCSLMIVILSKEEEC